MDLAGHNLSLLEHHWLACILERPASHLDCLRENAAAPRTRWQSWWLCARERQQPTAVLWRRKLRSRTHRRSSKATWAFEKMTRRSSSARRCSRQRRTFTSGRPWHQRSIWLWCSSDLSLISPATEPVSRRAEARNTLALWDWQPPSKCSVYTSCPLPSRLRRTTTTTKMHRRRQQQESGWPKHTWRPQTTCGHLPERPAVFLLLRCLPGLTGTPRLFDPSPTYVSCSVDGAMSTFEHLCRLRVLCWYVFRLLIHGI